MIFRMLDEILATRLMVKRTMKDHKENAVRLCSYTSSLTRFPSLHFDPVISFSITLLSSLLTIPSFPQYRIIPLPCLSHLTRLSVSASSHSPKLSYLQNLFSIPPSPVSPPPSTRPLYLFAPEAEEDSPLSSVVAETHSEHDIRIHGGWVHRSHALY